MSAPAAIELDAQYRQLREECALLDRAQRGSIAVRGSEAAEYLQGQLTNEIEELRPGAGCYAALLDRKGHVQADMRVLRTATDEFLLDTEEEGLEAARRHLQTYNDRARGRGQRRDRRARPALAARPPIGRGRRGGAGRDPRVARRSRSPRSSAWRSPPATASTSPARRPIGMPWWRP